MNKNGWGLRAELGFILLFLFCLLISTIGIHSLGLMKDKEGAFIDLSSDIQSSYNYGSLEAKLSSAAYSYYKDTHPYGSNSEIRVTSDTLYYNHYIDKLKDGNGRECSGYARILTNGNVVSYIKCPRYTTTGYKD